MNEEMLMLFGYDIATATLIARAVLDVFTTLATLFAFF